MIAECSSTRRRIIQSYTPLSRRGRINMWVKQNCVFLVKSCHISLEVKSSGHLFCFLLHNFFFLEIFAINPNKLQLCCRYSSLFPFPSLPPITRWVQVGKGRLRQTWRTRVLVGPFMDPTLSVLGPWNHVSLGPYRSSSLYQGIWAASGCMTPPLPIMPLCQNELFYLP